MFSKNQNTLDPDSFLTDINSEVFKARPSQARPLFFTKHASMSTLSPDEPDHALAGHVLHLRIVRFRSRRVPGRYRRTPQDGPTFRKPARHAAHLLGRKDPERRDVQRLLQVLLHRSGVFSCELRAP